MLRHFSVASVQAKEEAHLPRPAEHVSQHFTKNKKDVKLSVSHAVPALLGFSATQAIVIPPISESLKRSRKVPLGLDISIS